MGGLKLRAFRAHPAVAGMCRVMRAMKSHGLNTSKLRWIFGFNPER